MAISYRCIPSCAAWPIWNRWSVSFIPPPSSPVWSPCTARRSHPRTRTRSELERVAGGRPLRTFPLARSGCHQSEHSGEGRVGPAGNLLQPISHEPRADGGGYDLAERPEALGALAKVAPLA